MYSAMSSNVVREDEGGLVALWPGTYGRGGTERLELSDTAEPIALYREISESEENIKNLHDRQRQIFC